MPIQWWRGQRWAAAVASALTIIGLLASPAAASPQEVGVWTFKETAAGPNDEMFAIGAVSEQDVWVVGRTNGAVLWSEHWDGTTWSVVPMPQEPDLPQAWLGAAAAVGHDDVWASGGADEGGVHTRGLLRHWDGTAWNAVVAPHAGLWSLYAGLAFSGGADGWLTGADAPDDTGRPTTAILDHWDGTGWSESPLPPDLCGGQESFLYDVAAVAVDDAWAVGNCGPPFTPLLLHWDGLAWTQTSVQSPPADSFFDGVSAIASDDVWAVGSQGGPEPFIEHWDGSSWTSVTSSSHGEYSMLQTIAGVSSGDLWAVGYWYGEGGQLPLIEHWDGTAWTPVDGVNPFGEFQMLTDIVALPTGVLWTVGTNLFEEMIESGVGDDGFAAGRTSGRLGSAEAWHFPSANQQTHSVTDPTGCGLFDSGLRPADESFLFPFTVAGTYTARDDQTATTETVGVPMIAVLKSGKISARWATVTPAVGFVFDVQVRSPGSSHWFGWRRGVTTLVGLLTPSASGTYVFRARLRNPGLSCASGWSPGVKVSV